MTDTQEPTLAPSGDVERVARAIFDADVHRCGDWGARSNMVRDDYRNLARAAIAALHPQATAPLQEFDTGGLAGELERLDREATPGPWRVGTWGNGEHVPGLEHIFLDAIEATIQDVLAEDAALIVALRNNLPTILAALRSTQQPDLLPLLREAREACWRDAMREDMQPARENKFGLVARIEAATSADELDAIDEDLDANADALPEAQANELSRAVSRKRREMRK